MENPLINCEIELILTWSINCVITSSKHIGKLSEIDTKPYVAVVILWTQDNSKLLQKLKSSFKRIINWNKYELKINSTRTRPTFILIIWSKFLVAMKSFWFYQLKMKWLEQDRILPFESRKRNYNVMIDGTRLVSKNWAKNIW